MQPNRIESPKSRGLSILKRERSGLGQEAAKCLFIPLLGWASPRGLMGGDTAEGAGKAYSTPRETSDFAYFLFGELGRKGT